jgi:Macrocin-O-methyltransferase (TylF)
MRLTKMIRGFVELTGYTIVRMPNSAAEMPYDQDGLRSIHNHDFVNESSFCKAYERGRLNAPDHNWQWRVHIGLWAAFTASKLEGDFVECGVNYGFLSSAIMEFLDWNSMNRKFYLLDTFEGIDPRYVSTEECENGVLKKSEDALRNGLYIRGIDSVTANFSQWKNTLIIKGSVPETLSQVETQNVSYLHLDMNCAPPEVAAINFFWERLVPGAIVLLDDYAYRGYELQKQAMDTFAKEKNVMIASLPTGQGLLIKPSNRKISPKI